MNTAVLCELGTPWFASHQSTLNCFSLAECQYSTGISISISIMRCYSFVLTRTERTFPHSILTSFPSQHRSSGAATPSLCSFSCTTLCLETFRVRVMTFCTCVVCRVCMCVRMQSTQCRTWACPSPAAGWRWAGSWSGEDGTLEWSSASWLGSDTCCGNSQTMSHSTVMRWHQQQCQTRVTGWALFYCQLITLKLQLNNS